MNKEHLSKISTQWSKMELLINREGPEALAEFLASRYFNALALKLKKKYSSLDELQSFEVASDIIYEFIKNDYHTLKQLDRNRGHLRGLFFKIIQSKLSRLKKPLTVEDIETFGEDETEPWVDFYMDFDGALEKLKEERPRLHTPFVEHYLKGKKLSEIAEELNLNENAIKQRLHYARLHLAKLLRDYRVE